MTTKIPKKARNKYGYVRDNSVNNNGLMTAMMMSSGGNSNSAFGSSNQSFSSAVKGIMQQALSDETMTSYTLVKQMIEDTIAYMKNTGELISASDVDTKIQDYDDSKNTSN